MVEFSLLLVDIEKKLITGKITMARRERKRERDVIFYYLSSDTRDITRTASCQPDMQQYCPILNSLKIVYKSVLFFRAFSFSFLFSLLFNNC